MRTNWLGMPSHPTDGFAFWRRTEAELLEARALYDRVVAAGADPKDVERLLSWVASNAGDNEAFAAAGEAQ